MASAVTVAILAFPAVRALPDTAPFSIVEVPAASGGKQHVGLRHAEP
jgi:hypothetical protein